MGYFAKSRLPLNILLATAQELAERASFGPDITGQIDGTESGGGSVIS